MRCFQKRDILEAAIETRSITSSLEGMRKLIAGTGHSQPVVRLSRIQDN